MNELWKRLGLSLSDTQWDRDEIDLLFSLSLYYVYVCMHAFMYVCMYVCIYAGMYSLYFFFFWDSMVFRLLSLNSLGILRDLFEMWNNSPFPFQAIIFLPLKYSSIRIFMICYGFIYFLNMNFVSFLLYAFIYTQKFSSSSQRYSTNMISKCLCFSLH